MNYSEAAYFDGAHVAHIAAWKEHQRLRRILDEVSAKPRGGKSPIDLPPLSQRTALPR
jgi:hypothetical protein